jgi:hypothetical protein
VRSAEGCGFMRVLEHVDADHLQTAWTVSPS